MIIITTSRAPSQRTRSFVKELVAVLPGAERINRGKYTLRELGYIATRAGADYVWIVYEKRGNPSAIKIYGIDYASPGVLVEKYMVLLKGITLSREIGNPLVKMECLDVEAGECDSRDCRLLGQVFLEAIGGASSACPNTLILIDHYGFVEAFFTHNKGRAGPVIRVRGVRVCSRS